jgi:hypothetical protein
MREGPNRGKPGNRPSGRPNESEPGVQRALHSRARWDEPPIPDPHFGTMIYPTPSIRCRFGHDDLVNCAIRPLSLNSPLVTVAKNYSKYRF